MANIPNVRFKGFTDDWEQSKLGDLSSSLEYGLNAAAREFDGKNKYIRITDIDDSSHEFVMDGVTSPDIDLSTVDDYKLFLGDILFARTGASVGKSYIYKDSDGLVYFAGFLIRARIKKEYNPEFVFQNTLTTDYKKYITITSQRSGQPGVNAQEYSEYKIMIPERDEQDKISDYLRNIDYLITLHQRMCDEVKQLKKFMLQKMFPKSGEPIPEIRFAGFTDDWEQRKLKEVAEFSKGSGYSKGDLIDAGTPIILYGRLYTKYEIAIGEVDTFVSPKSGSVYSKGGEVIVPASGGTAEDIARAAVVENAGVLLGGDLNIIFPNSNINSAFLALSISNGTSQKELAKKAQGKSVVHIHNEDIRVLDIPFPSKLEQDKIAIYFSNLDSLITLHQRKCDELKEVKRFMLQNMFPQKG